MKDWENCKKSYVNRRVAEGAEYTLYFDVISRRLRASAVNFDFLRGHHLSGRLLPEKGRERIVVAFLVREDLLEEQAGRGITL